MNTRRKNSLMLTSAACLLLLGACVSSHRATSPGRHWGGNIVDTDPTRIASLGAGDSLGREVRNSDQRLATMEKGEPDRRSPVASKQGSIRP